MMMLMVFTYNREVKCEKFGRILEKKGKEEVFMRDKYDIIHNKCITGKINM